MYNSRTKRILRDVVLFAIASFGPKVLSFFLVPLYTSFLSTEAYGTFDLLNTIYSLLLPIFMLDISDAILFFTIGTKDDILHRASPLAYGTKILIKSSAVLFVISLIVIFLFSKKGLISAYVIYVVAQYIVTSLYYNLLAYLRGIDDIITVVVASIIYSLVTLLSNIALILGAELGLKGLFIASLLGGIAADIFIALRIKLVWELKHAEEFSKKEKQMMLAYSFPLIFTGLAWWINSSSDRLFISGLIGVGSNGIYAVANKIPTILNAWHSIIYQAMQLSVFKEAKSEDKSDYYLKLYRIYAFFMTFACCVLISLDKEIAKFLFKGEFYVAWKYCPALLISIAIYSIAGYMTTIYSAEKETGLIAKATVCGATVNTILNAILIPRYGLYGAVIATIVGYFLIWIILMHNIKEFVKARMEILRSIIGFVVLVLQWIALLCCDNAIFLQLLLITIIAITYFSVIKEIFSIVIGLVKGLGKK